MATPTQKQLHRPILEISADSVESLSKDEFVRCLKARLSLTEADLQETTSSGVLRINDRTAWAIFHLKTAGLMVQAVRGRHQITDSGRAFLKKHNGPIELATLKRMASGMNHDKVDMLPDETTCSKAIPDTYDANKLDDETTPEEMLDNAHQAIREKLAIELLESLREVTPAHFERLCVHLLERMGYGKGKEVGQSGDGGIDGVVNQDALGLEKVYIQAKRWSSAQVGEPEIRNFSGSLNARGASKGVFITTSSFNNGARQSAQTMRNQTIVLIGGKELAQLMIEHGVGVVTQQTYEIKKLDENYFAEDV